MITLTRMNAIEPDIADPSVTAAKQRPSQIRVRPAS